MISPPIFGNLDCLYLHRCNASGSSKSSEDCFVLSKSPIDDNVYSADSSTEKDGTASPLPYIEIDSDDDDDDDDDDDNLQQR